MQSSRVSTGDAASAPQYDNLRDDAYAASILRPHQQTTPGMTLYVENGAYYINGVRYLFAGGSTPAFTAPVSYPRIDLVTIDTTGTLTIVEGTEASSPTVPAYPENVVTLCEVYHVVGETAVYTSNNSAYGWTSSQGYIQNDVRPAISYGPNFASVGEDIVPDAADTRNLGSSGSEWNNIYAKNINAATAIKQNGQQVAFAKFGGTGTDGALSISSGITTINAGGAAVVIKNYTSISITGTASLALSNPNPAGTLLIFKSQGNVTITSSASQVIDLSGQGCQSGYTPTAMIVAPQNGNAGAYQGASGPAQPGLGAIATPGGKSFNLFVGAAGGVGGGTYSGGNVPGIGGASLYVECAGALNVTSAFKSNGTAGTAGTGSSATGGDASGGASFGPSNGGNSNTSAYAGGGGAGNFLFIYNTLTAFTATFTQAGGNGRSSSLGNGGIGSYACFQNTEFI